MPRNRWVVAVLCRSAVLFLDYVRARNPTTLTPFSGEVRIGEAEIFLVRVTKPIDVYGLRINKVIELDDARRSRLYHQNLEEIASRRDAAAIPEDVWTRFLSRS